MNEPRRPTTRWFSPFGYQIDQEREERVWAVREPPLVYASAAQRKPELPVELSGVFELRAATL
jgi:hypothetical protein